MGAPSISSPGQHRSHGSERGSSPALTAPPLEQHGFRDWGRGPTPAQTACTTLAEKGRGWGCGTAPSPAGLPGAGALRDLHGGSSGGARGRGDLAWSGTGSAAARTPREGRACIAPQEPDAPGHGSDLRPRGGPAAIPHAERPVPGEAWRPRAQRRHRSPSQ